ncbi:hypothetical protein K438DRAFT_1982915 [Mycena galopus ATCC 62051]|nr:hypothetical protein K438DRAFT_1982915 [Mycena galopus ATCC 62051]
MSNVRAVSEKDDDAWLRYFVRLPSLPIHRVRAPIPPRPSPIRSVAYLLVLETLNTDFDMQMMYQPLILQYGQVLGYIFFSPRRVLAIVARLAPHPRPRTAARPFPRSWIQN